MYLPRIEIIANAEVRVMGDVTIHPSAVIAKGTTLEAAPGSQIEIGSDVCIGIGTIITACKGSIEIESGAIIGAEVLIVGNCHIGRQACIGSSTTIFNTSVEAMQVISSGSLLGDTSRSVVPDNGDRAQPNDAGDRAKNFSQENLVSGNEHLADSKQTKQAAFNQSKIEPSVEEGDSFWFDSESPSSEKTENLQGTEESDRIDESVSDLESSNKVKPKNWETGQIYINQLLVTLFPNGRSFNRHPSKDSQ
jgi:carbon dioxide concentrating mechanism protein CcmN